MVDLPRVDSRPVSRGSSRTSAVALGRNFFFFLRSASSNSTHLELPVGVFRVVFFFLFCFFFFFSFFHLSSSYFPFRGRAVCHVSSLLACLPEDQNALFSLSFYPAPPTTFTSTGGGEMGTFETTAAVLHFGLELSLLDILVI